MPELPEVEFCRRALTRWTCGRVVREAEVLDARSVRAARTDRPSHGRPDAQAALSAVVAAGPPGPIHRHGKRLLWPFGDHALLLHLGMTGKWTLLRTPWVKVRLGLDDGTDLFFADPRLLGGIVPTTLAEGRRLLSEGLGPDALDTPLPPLRGSRAVKVALMDQAVVAGLGNVHAMEALWRAGLDPTLPCHALGPEEHARLEAAVQEQLRATLAMSEGDDEIVYVEESLASNPFSIYRREGQPCPRCKSVVRRMIQGGRSTYWCPSCQPPTRSRTSR